jgi:anti-sigma B factor antagonist
MSKAVGGAGAVLKMSSRQEGDSRILKASGQLTERECAEFLKALSAEFDSGATKTVLDLQDMMYMSSAGLGALVSMHKKFSDAERRLILAGANLRVRKLLALTSLDKLMENAESVEDALK